MFEFARNSAKAVLVAAGAAGFAALGAGAASAAPVAAPQPLTPLTDAAPLMASAALAPVTAPLAAGEVPDMARTAPAPDTRNLVLAGSDASGAGGALDQGMTTLDGAVDQALGQGPAATQRQSSPVGGDALAGNPAPGLNGTVHSTTNQVLNSGKKALKPLRAHQSAPLAGNPVPGLNGKAHSTTNRVLNTGKKQLKPLRAHQSAPLAGNPAAGHPAKSLNGLVHGTVNSTPKGNPVPGAGPAVRKVADTASDMVVVAEQDDPRKLTSAEQGASDDLVGGVADQAGGAVGTVLPNTAEELKSMSEEPPVTVDQGGVADTVGGVTDKASTDELPVPQSLPTDAVTDGGLPTGGGLPTEGAPTDALNTDVADGLSVGPELPAPGGALEAPLG
ncbi:hypothetical protein O4J56_23780 [Nocardiopsis sp. RSe5-2]|uniref:ATP-binding protein n=1 Tax=Nocardiopsis endophytica TaxID=3018445 RepID=A0ABT4U9Q5_9ACTN|nr:hypothetical protein [Nocardiopsis endophytica]MDA2813685.1 hypothetical protein [Nocardiopsis endophytica]